LECFEEDPGYCHQRSGSSLRSWLLVSMFGIPLMVTGIFYFMFGNIAEWRIQPAQVHVVIANLDEAA
jgi:hypothetical protein